MSFGAPFFVIDVTTVEVRTPEIPSGTHSTYVLFFILDIIESTFKLHFYGRLETTSGFLTTFAGTITFCLKALWSNIIMTSNENAVQYVNGFAPALVKAPASSSLQSSVNGIDKVIILELHLTLVETAISFIHTTSALNRTAYC